MTRNLTFVQLAAFVRSCDRLGIDDDAIRELERALMESPEAGVIMQGTGGLRKMRFSPRSWHRGKSGALRVCYAYYRFADHVYFVRMIAKNEQENLPPAEKAQVKKLLQAIEAELRGTRQ